MHAHTLTNLPKTVAFDDVLRRLHVSREAAEDIRPLYDTAITIAAPRAVICVSEVTHCDSDSVKIGGVVFHSRVLAVNLKDVTCVAPYVLTSGNALHDAARALDDPLEQYYLDEISEMILGAAMGTLHETAQTLLSAPSIYAMNPGSLPDWPMSQQIPLFSLLGDVFAETGVTLTDSCLMIPIKSVSGLFFASNEHYENCALCPRGHCLSRRAEFNAALYLEKYDI